MQIAQLTPECFTKLSAANSPAFGHSKVGFSGLYSIGSRLLKTSATAFMQHVYDLLALLPGGVQKLKIGRIGDVSRNASRIEHLLTLDGWALWLIIIFFDALRGPGDNDLIDMLENIDGKAFSKMHQHGGMKG